MIAVIGSIDDAVDGMFSANAEDTESLSKLIIDLFASNGESLSQTQIDNVASKLTEAMEFVVASAGADSTVGGNLQLAVLGVMETVCKMSPPSNTSEFASTNISDIGATVWSGEPGNASAQDEFCMRLSTTLTKKLAEAVAKNVIMNASVSIDRMDADSVQGLGLRVEKIDVQQGIPGRVPAGPKVPFNRSSCFWTTSTTEDDVLQCTVFLIINQNTYSSQILAGTTISNSSLGFPIVIYAHPFSKLTSRRSLLIS